MGSSIWRRRYLFNERPSGRTRRSILQAPHVTWPTQSVATRRPQCPRCCHVKCLKSSPKRSSWGSDLLLSCFPSDNGNYMPVHTGAIRVVGKSQFPPCASRVQGEEQSSPRRLGVCFGFKGKRIKAYTLHSTLF